MAATTKVNPLDKFVDSTNPNPTTFRVQPMPKLADYIKSHGLMAGAPKYDEAMEQWRQSHERDLQNQFKTLPTLPAGKLV